MDEIPASNALEADADGGNDDDSAFGDDNAGSSTTSIGSSILRYRQENGRTYHAYKDGQYLVYVDFQTICLLIMNLAMRAFVSDLMIMSGQEISSFRVRGMLLVDLCLELI